MYFHHEITDAPLPQVAPVFDDATALDTAVDILDISCRDSSQESNRAGQHKASRR